MKKLHDLIALNILFGSLLLSNAGVIASLLWLIPAWVYFETVVWLALGFVTVWALARLGALSNLLVSLKKNWIILPFVLFSALSIFWSVAWDISLSRWLILVASIVVGAYVGLRFELPYLTRLLSIFCVVILLLSLGLIVFAPRFGIMYYYDIQGAWKGIFWHKNHMGIIAAFASMMFLLSAIASLQHRPRTFWAWGVLYFLSLAFVYLTQSVGSYVTLAVVHAVLFLALAYLRVRPRLRGYHYALLLGAAVLAGILLYANLGRVFSLLNRSPSLTGRIPMWGHLFNIYFSQRPVFGYGFNAFWYIASHRETMGIVAGYPDPIVIADNGFIDILMGTGYIGLALFLIFYVGMWIRSVRYAWDATDVYGLFPLALMTFSLFANVSWTLLFEDENLLLLIMMSVMFLISSRRSVQEAERARVRTRGPSLATQL